ncbi:MAG TPA: ribonuclease HII [Chitinophagaceae bacterium]|jgi:ribonuclease HII|nr:ribonuclease HII [Chitinophagaceae bacterium]
MLRSHFQDEHIEAGCDEAGRGCLAGPVFAAAVILPRGFAHPLLNDSKQLSEKDRYALRPVIEQEAVAFAVAQLCNRQIDKINILKASFRSMHLAVKALSVKPGLLLVDGNRFTPFRGIPHKCIIGGDGLYASIAAASILAKTYRDDYMNTLHEAFPQYNWARNKGYGTREHQQALDRWGPTKYHRKSFRLTYNHGNHRLTGLFTDLPGLGLKEAAGQEGKSLSDGAVAGEALPVSE